MLACQRSHFQLPADQHYLNCAFMGPLPRSVEEAGLTGVRSKSDPTSMRTDDFFAAANAVRERFARLVGAPDPARVAIVPAVSYGMALVARNTPLAAGQTIVIAHEQFPSNVYPWRRMATERNATMRTVAPPEGAACRGEAWNEAVLDAIDEQTALVALPHVHWADGTRFDLARIGARARQVGAALVVDGTQSVGAMPFDLGRIQPDALIVAGYKWLLGPYGAAMAWFGPRYDAGEPLEENWINRAGSEDFSRLTDLRDDYQPGAVRFDMGERSNPILLPMMAAALDQILEWRPERIQAYCADLMSDAVGEARALGFGVEDDAWRGSHLFGLRMPPGLTPDAVQAALARQQVIVSVRSGAVRVSPNVYNDAADTDALISALRSAAA